MCSTPSVSRTLSIFSLLLCLLAPWTQSASGDPVRPANDAASVSFSSLHIPDGDFHSFKTEHYEIYYLPGSSQYKEVGDLLEKFHGRFFRVMNETGFTLTSPNERLPWLCFQNRSDFERYAEKADRLRNISWNAYYSARTNCVAILENSADSTSSDFSPQEIIHEAAHQLAFNSGIMKRGVMYPFWISEGFATYMENSGTGGHLQQENSGRWGVLKAMQTQDQIIPLDRFLSLTQIPAAEQESARGIYSQAWSLFTYAATQRRQDLSKYLLSLSNQQSGWRSDQSLKQEFTESFGPVLRFEQEWKGSSAFPQTIAISAAVQQVN